MTSSPPARGPVVLATVIMALGLMTGGLCASRTVGLLPPALLDSRDHALLVVEAIQAIFAAMAGFLTARRSAARRDPPYVWVGGGPVVLVLIVTAVPTLSGAFPWWRVPLDVLVVASGIASASWLRTRHDRPFT